jgi:hypothetical protein
VSLPEPSEPIKFSLELASDVEPLPELAAIESAPARVEKVMKIPTKGRSALQNVRLRESSIYLKTQEAYVI